MANVLGLKWTVSACRSRWVCEAPPESSNHPQVIAKYCCSHRLYFEVYVSIFTCFLRHYMLSLCLFIAVQIEFYITRWLACIYFCFISAILLKFIQNHNDSILILLLHRDVLLCYKDLFAVRFCLVLIQEILILSSSRH